jgi:hypothetical protein
MAHPGGEFRYVFEPEPQVKAVVEKVFRDFGFYSGVSRGMILNRLVALGIAEFQRRLDVQSNGSALQDRVDQAREG